MQVTLHEVRRLLKVKTTVFPFTGGLLQVQPEVVPEGRCSASKVTLNATSAPVNDLPSARDSRPYDEVNAFAP